MPEPRVLLGRYEVGDLIGAGGSARVHRAHDRLLDRTVAVKLLDAAAAQSADPAAHERFLREARTSAGFAHRHGVATYDAGDADGQLFLVMEYVEGPSLAQRIATDAPMAEAEIVRIGDQVLGALGAAHATGLVHRDIKPANILLDASGDAKLADFGIAKRFDELSESLTVAGMVIGTRDYLAPEQAAGAEVGPRTDLYALGVVLYEMATGARPTPAVRDEGADPRSIRPELAPALATTITTALAASPSDRFPSALAMASALTGELPPTELVVATPSRSTPDTLVMSAAGAAPTPGAPTSARTAPMAGHGSGGGRSAATSVLPPSPQPRSSRADRARWMLVAALVLGVFGATIVLASRTPDESADATVTDTTAAGPLAAASSTSPPTSPPTTIPPTTVPPTTSPPTTATPTDPPADELLPGFPATDDLDEFIEQLRDAKDVAGKRSKKLGDELAEIRDEDEPEKRDERVDELGDDLEKWVDKGELDPVVADRALAFLDELA